MYLNCICPISDALGKMIFKVSNPFHENGISPDETAAAGSALPAPLT